MNELDQILVLSALLLLAFQTLYLTFCVVRIAGSFRDLEKVTQRILARLSLQTDQIARIASDTKDLSNHREIMEHNVVKVINRLDIFKTFEAKLDKSAKQGDLILASILKGNKEANFDAARIKTRQTNERKRDKKNHQK
jgi:exopolysaccharide biosynthesis protein